MHNDGAMALLFLIVTAVLAVLLAFAYSSAEMHSEQKIVENTPACFYLDDDYKKQFSWDCKESNNE